MLLSSSDSQPLDIGKRLSRSTGMQVFVSCGDLLDDGDLLLKAERKLREMLKSVAVASVEVDQADIVDALK
jgi:hypothetical protein